MLSLSSNCFPSDIYFSINSVVRYIYLECILLRSWFEIILLYFLFTEQPCFCKWKQNIFRMTIVFFEKLVDESKGSFTLHLHYKTEAASCSKFFTESRNWKIQFRLGSQNIGLWLLKIVISLTCFLTKLSNLMLTAVHDVSTDYTF